MLEGIWKIFSEGMSGGFVMYFFLLGFILGMMGAAAFLQIAYHALVRPAIHSQSDYDNRLAQWAKERRHTDL